MNVVVGYIPSPEGLAAVDYAIEQVALAGGRLIVLNTGHHGNYADPAFADPRDLDALDSQLTEQGIEHEVRQPVQGRAAADEILNAAVETKADLIVIGLRPRTPVGKLITGSTAQQVLLDAECPVVAVKAASAVTPD